MQYSSHSSRSHRLFRRAVCALLSCLLLLGTAALLSGCVENVLFTTTQNGYTYTLSGSKNRVKTIRVSSDGKEIGTYATKGIDRSMTDKAFGFLLTDLNLDGHDDMLLLTAREKAGNVYDCFLWDETAGHYVYNASLSRLCGLTVASPEAEDDHGSVLLYAYDYRLTTDPATSDSPEYDTIRYGMTAYYLDSAGSLTPAARTELTYYEENEVYCLMTYTCEVYDAKSGDVSWKDTSEKWIFEEDFVPENVPLGHFFAK